MSGWRAARILLLFALPLFVSVSAEAQVPSFQNCDECPEVVTLPGSTYLMGSPTSEAGRHESEPLPHEVTVSPFAITATEITVGDFARFVEATGHDTDGPCWTFTDEVGWHWNDNASWQDPLFPQGADHPVTCINWHDADAFATWLSAETGHTWRLPTEEEWEYATRADTTGPRTWDGPPEDVCAHANINDISGKNRIWKVAEPCDDGWLYTATVGFFAPNPFGLYDMQGNVWEWVQDCETEESAGTPCTSRVLRGGSWTETPGPIRISIREWRDPATRYVWAGFRLVREIE